MIERRTFLGAVAMLVAVLAHLQVAGEIDDLAYHGLFKCNLRRLIDYPNLWGYARDIYQRDGIGDTVSFDHIKRHYYMTHDKLNPSRIVPKGPIVDWSSAHTRSSLA